MPPHRIEPAGRPKPTGTARNLFWRNLRRLGYDSYGKYLSSGHWQQVRKDFYADEYTPKTCICGETKGLVLHHLTYERLGREQPEDLRPLCKDCHLTVHRLARSGMMDLTLEGYASDLRRARYIRERRERQERLGEPDLAGHDEEPFAPHQWNYNSRVRHAIAREEAGIRSRPSGRRAR